MSSKAPIFPMTQPQHFSDYGFDPQIDYFQVLEEARKHKREATSRSIDSIRFKLTKPISKDDHHHHYARKSQKRSKRWWNNALFFFKCKWAHGNGNGNGHNGFFYEDVHQARARAFRAASISGPVYLTDSTSGTSTPRRSSGRYSPGPIAGTLSPADDDDVAAAAGNIPYVSLRQLNMEQRQRVSTSAMPIYLVT